MKRLTVFGCLVFFTISVFADNPCGLSCTQKVVTKLITNNPKLKGPKGDRGPAGPVGSISNCVAGGTCLIFVTATRVLGDLNPFTGFDPYNIGNLATGGRAAATTICEREAARRFPGKNFVAWIAETSPPGPIDEPVTPAYVNDDGTKSYISPTGELIAAPGQLFLQFHTGVVNGSDQHVWTGAEFDGTPNGNNCGNFSSGVAGLGRAGQPYQTEIGAWTSASNQPCTSPLALYCVETG